MADMEIRKWVESQLGGLGKIPANALTATFQIAILRALSLRMTKRVHEEPMTGFLLGAFASLAPVCSSAFGDEDVAQCEWQYFPKSGTGWLTEPGSGADFALIVENDGQLPRLAIFQAKRENERPPDSFKIHQIRERRDDVNSGELEAATPSSQIPQFLRLLEHSQKVARLAKAPDSIIDVHWTHYLIYSPSTLRCVSLDQLNFVKACYDSQGLGGPFYSPGTVYVNKLSVRSFLWLLTRGANPSCDGEALKGWLQVPHELIQVIRDSLISFTDVYVAHHGPSPTLENDPGSDPSTSPDVIVRLACEALLSLEDVPDDYRSTQAPNPNHAGSSWRKKSRGK